jgi:hypothetical protein
MNDFTNCGHDTLHNGGVRRARYTERQVDISASQTFMSVPMNIEQSVIANLRLLPTERQQDVLVYIHSLLPRDAQSDLRMGIREQVIPALQQIQNFHDGLPSAIYADRLLRSTQELSTQFPDTAFGQILQTLHRSLAEDNRWGCYTVEYYQTVIQMLTELTDRSALLPSDLEMILHRLEEIRQTMIQTGVVTDQELEDHVEI